jgi:hypothetical protein
VKSEKHLGPESIQKQRTFRTIPFPEVFMKRQHPIAAIVSTILMAISFFSQAVAQQGSNPAPAQQTPAASQQTQQGQPSTAEPVTAPSGTAPANDQTAAPANEGQQTQQQQTPAPSSSGGTTINPSQAPLQPVTTYPDASGAQQQEQPNSTANPQTTTAPDAPQPKKQPAEPVGAAAAESVPTAGGAAAKPAGVAIAPAKQHQTRSLLLKIGAIAAAGAALGAVFALSHSTPSTPPGTATPGATAR